LGDRLSANKTQGRVYQRAMRRLSEIARILDGIVLSATPVWVLVPIFFGGLLYFLPNPEAAWGLAIIQIALVITLGRIFLLEHNEFSHGQGIWLGLTAFIAVTVGFGGVYSALLLKRFPTEVHFRFADGTKSLEAMNDIHGAVQIQVDAYVLKKAVENVLACKPQKEDDKHCEPRLPSWSEEEKKSLEFELGQLVYRLGGEPGLGMDQMKSWMISEALKQITHEEVVEDKYLHALFAELGPHARATNFYFFDPTEPKNAGHLDFLSQTIFPHKIGVLISGVINCRYRIKSDGCGSNPKTLSGTVVNGNQPPWGSLSLARLIFAEKISASLGSFKVDTSELVFNSFLFSALSLATQGHPDMVATSTTARVILAGELLSFVMVTLLMLPVGLKQRPHKEESSHASQPSAEPRDQGRSSSQKPAGRRNRR
jgi:hypothetical protein